MKIFRFTTRLVRVYQSALRNIRQMNRRLKNKKDIFYIFLCAKKYGKKYVYIYIYNIFIHVLYYENKKRKDFRSNDLTAHMSRNDECQTNHKTMENRNVLLSFFSLQHDKKLRYFSKKRLFV